MTRQQHQARQLIAAWLAQQKIKPIEPMAHIEPRGYVVAKPGYGCITVAVPFIDCEPQIAALHGANQYRSMHVFDKTIDVGDWVACAYIVTPHYGQSIAVAWPKPAKPVHF